MSHLQLHLLYIQVEKNNPRNFFLFLFTHIIKIAMTSPTGQIILTGIVILANARPIDPEKGNRNVAFDVTLPVKDGNTSTLGLLRYFTPENRVSELQQVWNNDFTQAFVVAKVRLLQVSYYSKIFHCFNIYTLDGFYAGKRRTSQLS